MALVKVKPTSNGRRSLVKVVVKDLHKGAPYAPLLEKQSKTAGRNNSGRITMRHKGGGHKHHYRHIDLLRNKDGIPAKVERIEHDPNRSAHIALLCYADGERRYIIAPKGIAAGATLMSGSEAPIKAGNALPLRNIPVGSTIHCIEMQPGKGAQLARSAGGFGPVGCSRGKLRPVTLALWRDSSGPCGLSRDYRRGRERGAQPRIHWQGRSCALARYTPDSSWCCDEPG